MPIKVLEKGITFDDILLIPEYSEIESRLSSKIDLSTNLTKKIKLKIPFISAPMSSVTDLDFAEKMEKVGGKGIIHRYQKKENQIFKRYYQNKRLVCAVGLKDRERVNYLYKNGVRTFLIDIASGFNKLVGDEIKWMKGTFEGIEIIAGNIVTVKAAEYLIDCGVDALRVGIGNGASCKTRIATGCGVSQLTAIEWCRKGSDGRVPIISDGGIKTSGDCVKALAWGADVIMSGFLFTQFSNSGKIIRVDNTKYKIYVGQASREFQEEYYHGMKEGTAPEGVSFTLPMRYDINFEIYIGELVGGIRSSMSYLNCKTLKDLRNCNYIEVSEATKIENHPSN